MEGFITYNPLNPFDGPTAADDPPPAYYDDVADNKTKLAIDNPAFPGSAVYRRQPKASYHEEELKITGQGTVAVLAPPDGYVFLYVDVPGSATSKGIVLLVTKEDCQIWWVNGEERLNTFDDTLVTEKNPNKATWRMKDYEANYWLSLDLPHGLVRYGIGLFTVQSVLFEIRLKDYTNPGVWSWKEGWEWLQHLKNVRVWTGGESQLAITPLPIVNDIPPLIRSGDQVSLADLAGGQFTVPENLSVECQKLYHNVAGVDVVLDSPDFPDFSSAIEYSVNTPGAYGYQLLKSKQGELGDDFRGTYLRITIGTDLGDSPGVPYVLEIWPAGHFSPIHDHGDAYAVIKVLHGAIECTYYDSLQESPEPNPLFPNPTVLNKGEITWLSPKIYQIHRLRNLSTEGKVCCTVQCYQYGSDDTRHYEAFRWFKVKDGVQEVDDFKPNSDADFMSFKNTIREEWKKVLSGKTVNQSGTEKHFYVEANFMATNSATGKLSDLMARFGGQ
ncbi:hypothetical protein VKT23_015090 [Stygiomarasmius scandens]|uniref:Cysteine dioxygenase n=1 Tax=Marasmiellus scandens TaxID=2682957 RepID=A0ABR1IYS9_9AGAR